MGGGGVSIQSAAAQAAALAQARLQNMGLPLSILHGQYSTPSTPQRESESQQIARTICVENVPVTWTLLDLNSFFSAAGVITDKKIINGPKASNRMALVEFSTSSAAQAALNMATPEKTLKIGLAKTTVTPRDPDNISFDLPPGAPIPVAYQQVKKLKLEEKLARVKAMSQGLSKKFSAHEDLAARRRSMSSGRSEDNNEKPPVENRPPPDRPLHRDTDGPRTRRRGSDRYARFFKDEDYYRRRRSYDRRSRSPNRHRQIQRRHTRRSYSGGRGHEPDRYRDRDMGRRRSDRRVERYPRSGRISRESGKSESPKSRDSSSSSSGVIARSLSNRRTNEAPVPEREPEKIAPVEERRDIDHVASSPSLESKPRVAPLGLRSYAAHMDEDEEEIQKSLAEKNRDVVLEETARPSRVDMIDDDSDSPKRKRDAEESVPEFKRYGRDKSALRKRRGRRESRRKGDNRSSSDSDESVNRKVKKKKESKKKHSRHDSGRRREKKEKRSRRSGSSD